jgi:hypothetical protein
MAARKADTRDGRWGEEWLVGARSATLASAACADAATTMLSVGSAGQPSSTLSLAACAEAASGRDSVAGNRDQACDRSAFGDDARSGKRCDRVATGAGGGISDEARLENGGIDEMSAASRGGMLPVGGGADGAQEGFAASPAAARASCSARVN